MTDTTHCPERVFSTHNSTPHERKIDTENLTAKGTRNSTINILVNIQPLRCINEQLGTGLYLCLSLGLKRNRFGK